MSGRTATVATVGAGALLLLWPAFLNRYPIVFSDTFGYLEQGIEAYVAWDKPWIYGPLLVPLHARLSLWPVVVAQSLLLSTMLWLVQRTLLPRPRRTGHILLTLALALGSAAPWFTTLVMADILTPICVLGLFLLAYGSTAPTQARLSRPTLVAVGIVTTLAIAAHLSHLILAAACVATLTLLRWRTPRTAWRPALPLAAALLTLLAINAVGQNRLTISPYGSVYALARLVADGPAADTIREACPGAGWYLCNWTDHLTTDSDAFLWSPTEPMSKDGYGPIRLAPEASAILRQTVLHHPVAVAVAAIRNTASQLALNRIGDALIPDYLDATVRETLKAYFPPTEVARFENGLQSHGRLRPLADPFNPLLNTLLLVGAATSLWIAAARHRSTPALAAFATLILVAVLANAFATGALSGPHDRYGARIAWLVLLPPALTVLGILARASEARAPSRPNVARRQHATSLAGQGGTTNDNT